MFVGKREKKVVRVNVTNGRVLPASAESYRRKRLIKDSVICQGTVVFHLCPRRKAAIPRDSALFCDQCGQCLDWRKKGRRAAGRNLPALSAKKRSLPLAGSFVLLHKDLCS